MTASRDLTKLADLAMVIQGYSRQKKFRPGRLKWGRLGRRARAFARVFGDVCGVKIQGKFVMENKVKHSEKNSGVWRCE